MRLEFHMTELPMFSLEETARGLREIAAAKPDKVYRKARGADSCQYIHGKKTPGCIVGAFAVRNGVPVDYLLAKNDSAAYELTIWADDGEFSGRQFAERVQYGQDGGATWARAFNDALAVYPVAGVEAIPHG
jgi:hypothetical protein